MPERTELERRILRAEELGQKWAAADEIFYQLDETKKTVLADLMRDLDTDGKASEARLERLARSSQQWRDHIGRLAIAKGEMLRAKVRYESAVAYYEAARTTESTKRVEMQLLRDKT